MDLNAPSSGLRTSVARALAGVAGGEAQIAWQPLGRGVGGARWRARSGGRDWFVKTGDDPELLAAEADGLTALEASRAVRTPHRVQCGAADGDGFIVMEWLALTGGGAAADARLGEGLAALHRCQGARFGWHRHNFIGATPQFNNPSERWPEFFRDHRLGFQLRLAAENGQRGVLEDQGQRLMGRVPEFFSGYRPVPSLLHGDLWSGNCGVLASGEPVIFDPAVYYGDRETDIAMTELFGGFTPDFYAAYAAALPLDPGYRVRRDLYNLYHVLNHLNLFGASYRSQALQLIARLLAELG